MYLSKERFCKRRLWENGLAGILAKVEEGECERRIFIKFGLLEGPDGHTDHMPLAPALPDLHAYFDVYVFNNSLQFTTERACHREQL